MSEQLKQRYKEQLKFCVSFIPVGILIFYLLGFGWPSYVGFTLGAAISSIVAPYAFWVYDGRP